MLSLEISGGSSLFGSTGDSSTVWGLSRTGSLERQDRKSTRLNSSHGYISYAVFCLKKKKKQSITMGDKVIIVNTVLYTGEKTTQIEIAARVSKSSSATGCVTITQHCNWNGVIGISG